MSETFGQRLSRLRKEKGLTQEDIAKRIIISPQAVSKWENDLSSPDILVLSSLADILGVSVDELLGREESTSTNKEETHEENQEEASEVVDDDKKYEERREGIHIVGDDSEVSIDKSGIYVKAKGEKKKKVDVKKKIEKQTVYIFTSSLFMGLALIAFFLLGIFWKDQNMGWKMGWISFLYAIVLSSIPYAIKKRRFTRFNYPVLATSAYLTLGFLGMYLRFEGWGVYWFLFITIPAYYLIFGPIDKFIHRNEEHEHHWDDDDDDDDDDDEDDD